MTPPCDTCPTRKMYARTFDMHFSGEDCPYECKEYERWKAFQEELSKSLAKPVNLSATDWEGVNFE